MNLDHDFIICGGGISGLLLTVKLSQNPLYINKSILLIDPVFPKLDNDRTLCFWDKGDTVWDSLMTCKWENVIFKNGTHVETLDLDPLNYKMLTSKSFYNYVNSVINKNKNVKILKSKVINYNDLKSYCIVKTKYDSFKCRKVFNSVMDWDSTKNNIKFPLLLQHFEGWVIKTEKENFDPKKATFMDFSINQNSSTQFMYILPFSKTEALVEYTLFSEQLLETDKYKSALKDYLSSLGILNYQIKSRESGKIPMTCYPFFELNTKNILNIGSAGGWSKPSTGYTFKNIDRNTSRILDFLKEDRSFKDFLKKDRFWFYDLIFLDVLFYKNHLGKTLFTSMFKKNDPKTIFRFLDNKSSIYEEFKIMLSFPKLIFLSAVLKRLFKGL
jgi:lycopene beta-cyclase